MIRISDIRVSLDYDLVMLRRIAAQILEIDTERIVTIEIVSRSVNSKDKEDIHFTIGVIVDITGDENEVIYRRKTKSITKEIPLEYTYKKENLSAKDTRCESFIIQENNIANQSVNKNNNSDKIKKRSRPVVVGCGPAGLFAALILAKAGTRPILLERGQDIDRRRKSVNKFWNTGELDIDSNVQFGEGGAGAFSDGKLKTGKKDPRKMMILKELVKAGAPPEIMYIAKPHIGTDRLNETVKGIRNKIIGLGGEVWFNTILTRIIHSEGRVRGIEYLKNGNYAELSCENVILAIGNSARDTIEALFDDGILMEQKTMAIGLRIEHPREYIDRIKYGEFAGHQNSGVLHPALGAADYKMVVHLPSGRGVYTFCMCPGGSVVAASSEENAVVTNGMSEYSRDGKNSNSAILVTINKSDTQNTQLQKIDRPGIQNINKLKIDRSGIQDINKLKIDKAVLQNVHEKDNMHIYNPLAGIDFQRRIESQAYIMGGGGYKAPVQRLEDFLLHQNSTGFGDVLPTYTPGTCFAQVDSYLPEYVSGSIRQAINEMDEWMPGFAFPDALLTGPETRSSSPVRILRGANFQAIGASGLFPCGEGAGYSGGIISAAVDGVICAEQILT